ncbi:MAG: MFS transporter [Deltaproteobacteria bacterium]|nr:MFS transporter [Deltaproteobacteria bacterium]
MVRYKSVITINFSAFLLMLGVGMIVALLPKRIINLSGSVASVGYLASAYAVSNMLLQFPIGYFSDRFGFKSFIAGGYFFCSLTGLLYFFAETPNLIFWGRMLQGVGEAPIWALAPALLSIQYPAEKGKFMGIYNASLHCGLTVGSLMGILIYRTWQGNEAFLLFAGVSFLGGLLIALFVENPFREPNETKANINFRAFISLADNLINRTVLAGIVLYGAGYGIFITIIPAFLISERNSDQTTVGVFFSLFYIALSLSQLVAGPFSDRKGRKPAMVYGTMVAALAIATFFMLNQPWLNGLLTIASLGLGVFCVSSMAFLNERVPNALKGAVSGAFYFSWGAGYFFGPLILGKLTHYANLQTGFSILGGLFMLEFLALAIIVKSTPMPSKLRTIECLNKNIEPPNK